MVFHKPDFCRGIAMVLQGESLRAGCYVTHNGSLGGLRERIVRRLIRDQMPATFQVDTGLVHDQRSGATSRQCDILIHDSSIRAPLYRWEDFVVVHSRDARSVVEVKSMLNAASFEELLNVNHSLVGMGPSQLGFVPTFGFALDGVSFSTFIEYIQSAVRENRLQREEEYREANWPVCIVVQARNYLGLRPIQCMAGGPGMGFCAVDFTRLQRPADQSIDGIETGHFIDIYGSLLSDPGFAMFAENVYSWFNQLPIEDAGKVWVTPDGEAHLGRIRW